MQVQGYVAEVVEPDKIPQSIRYFGADMPYITRPVLIGKDELVVAPRETGNKRCA